MLDALYEGDEGYAEAMDSAKLEYNTWLNRNKAKEQAINENEETALQELDS